MSAARLISYEFPLRPDLTVNLWFPADLTREDADRVTAFIRSLVRGEGDQ